MSYQGEDEYLCDNGHYHVFNCYDSGHQHTICHCGAGLKWWHPVDMTNGYDDDDPACCYAPNTPLPTKENPGVWLLLEE